MFRSWSPSPSRRLAAWAEVVHDHRQDPCYVASHPARRDPKLACDLADRGRTESALHLVRRDGLVLAAAQPRLSHAAQTCAL